MTRAAFLYMDPDTEHDFAQCKHCMLFQPEKKRCSILGDSFEVKATDSCGLYISGEPDTSIKISKRVSPETAGFVHGKVRCEHCEFYDEDDSTCLLFRVLNVPSKVNRDGCCNAFERSDDQPSKKETLKKFIK